MLLRVCHRRSERHTQTGKTHDLCIYSFSFPRSIPQVVRRAAAPLCCGVVLRRRAGGPRGVRRLSRHTPQTRCFTFVWHHSVMRAVVSLLFTRSCVVFCKTCLGAPLNVASRLSTHRQFHFWRLYVHRCDIVDVFPPRSSFELLVQHIFLRFCSGERSASSCH